MLQLFVLICLICLDLKVKTLQGAYDNIKKNAYFKSEKQLGQLVGFFYMTEGDLILFICNKMKRSLQIDKKKEFEEKI